MRVISYISTLDLFHNNVSLLVSLILFSQKRKNISNFMQSIKIIIDNLVMIGHDFSDEEIIYTSHIQ